MWEPPNAPSSGWRPKPLPWRGFYGPQAKRASIGGLTKKIAPVVSEKLVHPESVEFLAGWATRSWLRRSASSPISKRNHLGVRLALEPSGDARAYELRCPAQRVVRQVRVSGRRRRQTVV